MGIIYKATNKINNKSYIGQSKFNLSGRIRSHKWRAKEKINTHFYNAIRKYGFENFEWVVIDEPPNEKLDKKEIFYINKYDTFKNGYNMTKGGIVTVITDEIRKKLSKAQVNRFKKPEERKKISDLQSKWFIIENIRTKESFLTFGLNNFCREHKLSRHCMGRINRGKMKVHKGEWTNVRQIK